MLIYELWAFLRSALHGSFARKIYYNRYGEAYLDFICIIALIILIIIGIIFYIMEVRVKNAQPK